MTRYGGEEFAIILPIRIRMGLGGLRRRFMTVFGRYELTMRPGDKEPYVTVTMGVSTVIPGHENSPQMLVQASDLALYHAKQQGRNRTYVNGHYNTVNTAAAKTAAKLDAMLLDR